MVVHKSHYSLKIFRGASGQGHHVLYTANNSRGKLSRLAKQPRKFFPSNVLQYTVAMYSIDLINVAWAHVLRYLTYRNS